MLTSLRTDLVNLNIRNVLALIHIKFLFSDIQMMTINEFIQLSFHSYNFPLSFYGYCGEFNEILICPLHII